jgi:hypothetical protein
MMSMAAFSSSHVRSAANFAFDPARTAAMDTDAAGGVDDADGRASSSQPAAPPLTIAHRLLCPVRLRACDLARNVQRLDRGIGRTCLPTSGWKRLAAACFAASGSPRTLTAAATAGMASTLKGPDSLERPLRFCRFGFSVTILVSFRFGLSLTLSAFHAVFRRPVFLSICRAVRRLCSTLPACSRKPHNPRNPRPVHQSASCSPRRVRHTPSTRKSRLAPSFAHNPRQPSTWAIDGFRRSV